MSAVSFNERYEVVSISFQCLPFFSFKFVTKGNKEFFFTLFWRVISWCRAQSYQQPFEKNFLLVTLLMKRCHPKYATIFSQNKKIIILFTIVQNLLPLTKTVTPESVESFLQRNGLSLVEYLQFFTIRPQGSEPLNVNFRVEILKTWNQFLLFNFIILEAIITKRTNKTFRTGTSMAKSAEESVSKNIPLPNPLKERFSPFLIVGFNEIRASIKEIATSIIDHKFNLLFAVFARDCFEYKSNIKKEILAQSLALPFDDNQIVKAHYAIELYRSYEHLKAYQLIQQFLEKERVGDKMMLALVSLSSLICGRYINKPEVQR